ncbi:hypothetical protein ACPPVO_36465 [Dactylosporangium sp. McL0621]|uniref:hypothetical protein n=1 Tax=Dactylosporangium sp. McL0621 TaxID=3415678 RepID=UPI003CF79992
MSAAEPTVDWFTDVSRPAAATGRRVINELYSRYPDQSAHTWARLHSSEDQQFDADRAPVHVHDAWTLLIAGADAICFDLAHDLRDLLDADITAAVTVQSAGARLGSQPGHIVRAFTATC